MAVRAISLFAGVGGLDLGVRLAIPEALTVCYVEREIYAAAVLAARMGSGDLDEAPIYSDVESFDARPWRGEVDLVHGGIPCQPYSLAGEQKGDEDERALWPEFARVVAECRPSLVFIENVPAFVARGGFRPLGEELCRLGYELEDPIFLRASDVGAPHIRERVFILAHHLADTEGLDWREREPVRGEEGRTPIGGTGRALDNTEDDHRGSGEHGEETGTREEEEWRRGFASSGEGMADADRDRFRIIRCSRKSGKRFQAAQWLHSHGCYPYLADTSGDRLQRWNAGITGREETDGTGPRGGARPVGGKPVSNTERYSIRERAERGEGGACSTVAWHAQPFPVGLYPPGPKDFDDWRGVIGSAPFLAPAVESGVRLLADGVAMVLDEDRAHQLRCTGNGVVPSQAGWALMTLLEWAGLR